jgi:RNA-directed DNA polymerase
VLLDEADKELEKRGHSFVRYADGLNVYVRSRAAGERVMAGLRRLFAKLRLRVNEAKSAVARATERKFLGFSFWVSARDGKIERRIASQALNRMKERVREPTRRNGGRSLPDVCEELGRYLAGWKGYFRFTEMPSELADLDRWIRHRLRAVQLKQWKRGTTVFRELAARGLKARAAARVAMNTRRWWRTSAKGDLNVALPNKLFDKLGVPRLAT